MAWSGRVSFSPTGSWLLPPGPSLGPQSQLALAWQSSLPDAPEVSVQRGQCQRELEGASGVCVCVCVCVDALAGVHLSLYKGLSIQAPRHLSPCPPLTAEIPGEGCLLSGSRRRDPALTWARPPWECVLPSLRASAAPCAVLSAVPSPPWLHQPRAGHTEGLHWAQYVPNGPVQQKYWPRAAPLVLPHQSRKDLPILPYGCGSPGMAPHGVWTPHFMTFLPPALRGLVSPTSASGFSSLGLPRAWLLHRDLFFDPGMSACLRPRSPMGS